MVKAEEVMGEGQVVLVAVEVEKVEVAVAVEHLVVVDLVLLGGTLEVVDTAEAPLEEMEVEMEMGVVPLVVREESTEAVDK